MAKANLKNIHSLVKVATQQLPVEDSFLADLQASIERIDALNARTPSQKYKPSSLACIRNMYFQLIGAPFDKDNAGACLIGICESGSDRHERIQDAVIHMKEMGVDCEYVNVADYVKKQKLTHLEIVSQQGFETKLYHKDLNISFLCDGIIKYKGEYYILEIKTESIYKWQSRTFVADEHLPQGTTYSICFGINKVLFLYENRDNCSKKTYMLNVTDEMKYDVLAKIEECDNYVADLIPPPIPSDISKKACTYCKYKTECRKAGK